MSESPAVKSRARRISIRLLPAAAESVFAGFCEKYQMFITGCVFPATTKNITYFPGSTLVANVPIPPTTFIQYSPVIYQPATVPTFKHTYIRCGCRACARWLNFKSLPPSTADPVTPPRFTPHFCKKFCSHFGVYHSFEKEGKPYIRRLILGNNKRFSDLFAPYIQSWVCWNYNGDQGYPRNLRDAYHKFWSAHFSFSYTGRERALDDPTGYAEYLLSYTREAEQIAAAQGDQDISLMDLLSPLKNLVISHGSHGGVVYNLKGYPKTPPKALFVNREDDTHWNIDGLIVPDSKVKICSAYLPG